MPNVVAKKWAGVVVLLVAAGLYLVTIDNGLRPAELAGGDLITHQYAQVEARPSNAPGYPLYTMGGWLWFRLGRWLLGGWLNPVAILSLYSTVWGLASLVVLYRILLRVTDDRQWGVAALLTLFYGTTYFFWYYSVTTEQYTSAVFQTLLLIWLALKWDDQPRNGLLLAMAFVSGTMLANMVTTLFILPPLLGFIFLRSGIEPFRVERSKGATLRGWMPALLIYLRQPKLILQAIAVTACPLLSYGFIYIRGAQHPEWRGEGNWSSTGEWFWQFITIQQGRDELAPGLTWQQPITDEFPALMWQELSWPIFVGGLIGLAFLGWRRAIWLYTTLLIYGAFCWAYRFGNWFQVILPAYPLFIIGFAAGLTRLTVWARKSQLAGKLGERPIDGETNLASLLLRQGSHTFLFLLVVYRLMLNFPAANQHDRPGDTGLDPGWAILADQPTAPATLYVAFEERLALQYLQTMWELAEGVTLAPTVPQPIPPTWPPPYVSRQALAGHPGAIDLTWAYPQTVGGQLIALWSIQREQLPATVEPIKLNFGDHLRLVGWQRIDPPAIIKSRLNVYPNWQIKLYWQTTTELATDYTISVRPLVDNQLITIEGEPLIQDHQPVWGAYPTSYWTAGEIVPDGYALTLPAGISPEAVQIVVYYSTAGRFENLGVQTVGLGP